MSTDTTTAPPTTTDFGVIRRLLPVLRAHLGLFVLSLVLYPAVTAAQLVQPYLTKLIIDDHIIPKSLDGLGTLVVAYAGAVTIDICLRVAQTYISQLVGQRMVRTLRSQLFGKLQALDMAYLERRSVGQLMTRVTNDVEALAEMFSSGAITIIGDFVTLTGIVFTMVALDAELAVYGFLIVPVMMVFAAWVRPRARNAFRDVRRHLARINGQLNESVAGIRLIQTLGAEPLAQREFSRTNGDYRDANFRSIRYDATTYAVVEGLANLSIALLLLLGLTTFSAGVTEIGLFVAFINYLRRFFEPIKDLATKYTSIQSAMAAAERCVDLLDAEIVDKASTDHVDLPALREGIRFEHVGFHYRPDTPVLADLDFHVGRGEKVALVGPTGGGKTTIIKLLARLYLPTAGRILWDGVDLRTVSKTELRRRLAVVLQDTQLFNASIRDNIAYGLEAPSDEALAEAAAQTCASEVIARLPEGWDFAIGEGGQRLSVGERQLLAFARALAVDPELLILDEATSSVDPDTEAKIQTALNSLLENRTAIIIAHRLATIRRADRILVIQRGRIVEEGTHDALYAQGGVYRKLHDLQFQTEAP